MRLRRRDPSEKLPDDILHDGYNPEDLIANSDLTSEFVMEDDPEFRSLTNVNYHFYSYALVDFTNTC